MLREFKSICDKEWYELIVGVEAKVDEKFDKQVYEIIEALIKKTPEDAQGKYYNLPTFKDIEFYVENFKIVI